MHPKLHGSLAVVALMSGLLTGCSPNETADETADARSTTSSLASPTRPTTPPDVAELPAATIAQRAEAALRGARSLRIHGSGVDGKETIALDVGVLRTGGAAGSIALNGVVAKLIAIGKIVYLQPSERMLRDSVPKSEQKAAIEAMRGRWLKTSATDPDAADFVTLTRLAGIADMIFDDVRAGRLSKTGPKAINGVRCIGVSNRSAVLWVDVRNARPIRLDEKGTGAFNLSQYDAVPLPKAPPSRLVIDVDKLGS
jgi:hypothetical protein